MSLASQRLHSRRGHSRRARALVNLVVTCEREGSIDLARSRSLTPAGLFRCRAAPASSIPAEDNAAQNFLHCQAHAVLPQTTLAANRTSTRVHLFAILMHDETIDSLERTSAAHLPVAHGGELDRPLRRSRAKSGDQD